MPTLTITQPRDISDGGRIPHPKARIRTEKGKVLVLPFAPRGNTIGGWADPITIQPRPGRKPLALRDGDGLTTLGLTFTLARADHQEPIEDYLRALATIAGSGHRITLVNMSPQERGPWRISDVTVTGELKQHGTNQITRATVTLALVEASDANPKIGPVSGGHGGHGPGKHPKFYTIRKGDTLRKIANRFYGDPGVWRQIAKANNIKDPTRLKVGRKIKLPKVNT